MTLNLLRTPGRIQAREDLNVLQIFWFLGGLVMLMPLCLPTDLCKSGVVCSGGIKSSSICVRNIAFEATRNLDAAGPMFVCLCK